MDQFHHVSTAFLELEKKSVFVLAHFPIYWTSIFIGICGFMQTMNGLPRCSLLIIMNYELTFFPVLYYILFCISIFFPLRFSTVSLKEGHSLSFVSLYFLISSKLKRFPTELESEMCGLLIAYLMGMCG